MSRPGVSVNVSNGNLNIQAPSEFGTTVLLVAAPAAPVAGYGTAFTIKNKKQAQTAFAQAGNENVLAAIVSGFYAEAPEGTKLHVLAMARTTTLQTLFAAANAEKALNLANGEARLVVAIKFPDGGVYTPTVTNGFDVDVHNAVTAAHTLNADWLAAKKPFRAIIEGFAFADAGAAKDYATDNKNDVAIVVGAVNDSTALATMLVAGRAAGVSPQQNIGRVKTGSLNIAESATLKIGSSLIEVVDEADLDTLFDKRYISFERNQAASGYIVTNDNMLCDPTDDYNNLRYGRVIDNAVRIAYKTYYKELKDDVDVDENGRLSSAVEKALETAVESAVDGAMRSQLSLEKDGTAAVKALVNPDPNDYAALYEANNISSPNFNILETNTVYLFVSLRPKGSLQYINVYVGFEVQS